MKLLLVIVTLPAKVDGLVKFMFPPLDVASAGRAGQVMFITPSHWLIMRALNPYWNQDRYLIQTNQPTSLKQGIWDPGTRSR